jgi:aryl-alcohol dehydrogenase-like predicted oxidoreductase
MQRRELGPDGLAVPEIGPGCWQLGGGWSNDWNDDIAQQTLRTAADAGVYRARVRDFIRGPY